MNPFAGALHADGGLVSPTLLERLAEGVPEAAVELDGPVGVVARSGRAGQNGCRIVANARVDGRSELLRELSAAGQAARADMSDAQLILAGWLAWGAGCVERILGDFSFLVWDGARREVFAARDVFGVKHFHYTEHDGLLVFADRLPLLLRDPAVSREPDEIAIADYLMFGAARDGERTAYRGVRSLPPGHVLSWKSGRLTTRSYWRAPLDGALRYRRVAEYAEHFESVFGEAVRDRIRGERVVVLMSGGRDSTAVAATALAGGAGVAAATMVFDSLMPDRERHYAGLAAAGLGIAIDYLPVDGYRLFERWAEPALRRPEPADGTPVAAALADFHDLAARHGDVALTGFGADAVLRESESRLARLLVRGQVGRALGEAVQYARVHRRLPRPGLRTLLRKRTGIGYRPPRPPWLEPDFARRVDAAARWAGALATPSSEHPLRPEAHALLDPLTWSRIVAGNAPAVTGHRLEGRHPFLDRRVIAFLLSVPPALWYNDKGLLRVLLSRSMPAEFLRRQKTPLVADPIEQRLERHGPGDLQRTALADGIDRYVDRGRLPRYAGGLAAATSFDEAWLHLRPLNLSIWLERATAAVTR